jgi:hypothetical protein
MLSYKCPRCYYQNKNKYKIERHINDSNKLCDPVNDNTNIIPNDDNILKKSRFCSDISNNIFSYVTSWETGSYLDATGIVVLTRENCAWCRKAKEDITSKGIVGIKIFDIGTGECFNFLKKIGKNGAFSVPLYINTKNGKEKVGFAPIEEVIEKLKC